MDLLYFLEDNARICLYKIQTISSLLLARYAFFADSVRPMFELLLQDYRKLQHCQELPPHYASCSNDHIVTNLRTHEDSAVHSYKNIVTYGGHPCLTNNLSISST